MSNYNYPDVQGHFGPYGGRYVAETLMPALEELTRAYHKARLDAGFQNELDYYLRQYVGRPTPLYYAAGLSEHLQGPKIYLKREDLTHTGAHKINNTMGQVLLARRMGKSRVIAETGAGQHGVATATAAARFGLGCEVFMGTEDMRRQSLNVARMRLLGAQVHAVATGKGTLKDAMNEAMRYWVSHVGDTFYVLGTVAGPHPYPLMVRDFQTVIGRETREQCLEQEGRLPDQAVACIGGGSNAMGMFYPFLHDTQVALWGVEAGGEGLNTQAHAASITAGREGVLHGNRTMLLQDAHGQIVPAHSISAGLDYPGVGPEHALLHDLGRVTYCAVTDADALAACRLLSQKEGIMPALETAHAVAAVVAQAAQWQNRLVVICLSGRGDKDMNTVAEALALTDSESGGSRSQEDA